MYMDEYVNNEYVNNKYVEKSLNDSKSYDKNYEKYKIKNFLRDGKYYNIENYGSGSQGSFIKNAVTGIKYNIKVGSKYEDRLFKVVDSSARNKRNEPLMLYYNSPEEYENHHFTTVSLKIKQNWFKKKLACN